MTRGICSYSGSQQPQLNPDPVSAPSQRFLHAGVQLTTIQAQDLYDPQGDGIARWFVAMPVLGRVWSCWHGSASEAELAMRRCWDWGSW